MPAARCWARSGWPANTIGSVSGRLSRLSKNGSGKCDSSFFTGSVWKRSFNALDLLTSSHSEVLAGFSQMF